MVAITYYSLKYCYNLPIDQESFIITKPHNYFYKGYIDYAETPIFLLGD